MSNSVVTLSSFNLLFLTQVLTVLTSTIKYNEYVTDKGENISIPCIADGNIMWVKENGSNNNTIIQTGKYLVLTNVSASDRGVYVCFAAVTPRKSIPSSHRNDVRQPLEVDEHEESKDENALESDTGTAQPTLELNEKNKNASTTSMLPMPSDDTGSVTSQSSSTFTPSKVTATASNSTPMPASASINNSSSNATTSPVTGVSSTNITSTTTSNSSSSISISHSSRSSSNSNNTTSSNSNNNSNSSSSLSELTTSSSLLPHSEVMPDGEDDDVIQEFQAFQKINLTVRTPPGPVSQLYFKASTILGFLVWRFNKTNSGGYPVRSFTAEFRNVSYDTPPYNTSFEHEWSRMDPINIAPNVRQMEVYRLEPNTTYEFRMWANNHLGSGEVVTTNVTTLPETKEEEFENGWDSIELIPNIILNPGFSETDDGQSPPITAVPLPTFSRNIVFGDDSDSCDSESDHEPRMEKFKRKLSVFFTDPTIKRI
ncbi:myosin-G heavy chain isoform X3 [Stomoxys calcitrans]|uniref:myosin-G heavy chain isoform X3 n=1 Tax=Stomoxys calcitrans TaxID=35570 RepID=UPI0027E2BA55|nr:myosin-G heavy chain isoform X3 [Stomoxys calcitrans]